MARATKSSNNAAAPFVGYVRSELSNMLPVYQRTADCIAGSDAVKARGDAYLPRPNATDDSPENKARYAAYLARAVFYNVTRRTVLALAGQIFLREPQIDFPATLKMLEADANGENVPLAQHAEMASKYVFAYGRAGLFGDYPTTGGEVTAAAVASGDVRPVIHLYKSADIINWRKAYRGARQVYTLIVLKEPFEVYDDGFKATIATQYKVLRLVSPDAVSTLFATQEQAAFYSTATTQAMNVNSDVYMIEIWREYADTKGTALGFMPVERYFPVDKSGNFLTEIPFQFIGAEQNTDAIVDPPTSDLADMNLAHYRNSADYEETSFLTGQPTPFVSGVTEEWNVNVLKGTIQLGSRGVIPLPNGGTAGLLQAAANSVPFEAMQHKERQMVALGAKLVEQRQVQRTATEAEIEAAGDTSVLATIANNVSNAYQMILKRICVFTGDNPDNVFFKLNSEFDLTRMDANERAQLLLEWQAGAITTEEMRGNLRRGGVATLNDAEYKAQAALDLKARADNAALMTAAQTPTQAKGADPNNPPGRNPAKPTEPKKGA